MDSFPLQWCRQQFPALSRTVNDQPAIFLDGPAGTQVPESVITAISDYLRRCNANHGGLFATSIETDAMLHDVHQAMAEFVGASDADEITFGPNMTTLTFALSRALARTWQPGDEIVVTQLDHDANVSPWVLAARDAGATLIRVPVRTGTEATLDLEAFSNAITPRTRLVAVGCASNSTGTINPVRQIADWAHEHGAYVFLDAVHYAPHKLPDVDAFGADFLACSVYKFFGPHIGAIWGRRDILESLAAYKVRPADDGLPGKWMTGTQNHECLAGSLAALNYLRDVGLQIAGKVDLPRREAWQIAYDAIESHENSLALQLLTGLSEIPAITVYGITDTDRIEERLPTFSITHQRHSPAEIAAALAEQGIFVWHGNYYALELSEALGKEPEGMVRIGFAHYNSPEEVTRLLQALDSLS